MKPVIYLAASLLLFGITPAAWAGAAEDVAAINQQRTAAYEKGDADAYAAAYADNAAFTPSLQPFRVDGKAAIKDYFTTFFQTYPTRHVVGRQGSARAANDTIVVSDAYLILTLADKSGNASVHDLRVSTTWGQDGQRVEDRGSARVAIPAHSLRERTGETGQMRMRLVIALAAHHLRAEPLHKGIVSPRSNYGRLH